MYNRLLFDCPQLSIDVIFAAVSNQCPQRPPVWETLPALKVAAEGLIETRKEAFFERAWNCKRIFKIYGNAVGSFVFCSPIGECIP
jgi:hypothetical protein